MAYPTFLCQNLFASAYGTISHNSTVVSGVLAIVSNYKLAEDVTVSGTSSWTIQIDAGAAATITADAAACMGHNWNTVGVSAAYIESSTDGASWTVRHTFTPSNDRLLYSTFTSATARYWRYRVSGGTGNIRISILSLGQAFALTEGLPRGWDDMARQRGMEVIYNRDGQFMGASVRYRRRRLNINVAHMSQTTVTNWISTVGDPWILQAQPFFLAWDFDTYPERVYLCVWDDESFSTPFVAPLRRSCRRAPSP